MAFFLDNAYKIKKTEKDKRLKEYWKNKLLQDDRHDGFKNELKSNFKSEFKSTNNYHDGFKSEFNDLKFKSYQDLNDNKLLFSPNSKSESKRSESGYAPSILSEENDRNIRGNMISPNNNNNNNNKNNNINNMKNNKTHNRNNNQRNKNNMVDDDIFNKGIFIDDLNARATSGEKDEQFFSRKCYANESVRRIHFNNKNNNNNNFINSNKSYTNDSTHNRTFNNNNNNRYNATNNKLTFSNNNNKRNNTSTFNNNNTNNNSKRNNTSIFNNSTNNNNTTTSEWLSKVQQELEQQRKNWSGEVDKLLSPASINDNKKFSFGPPPSTTNLFDAQQNSFVDTSGPLAVFKAFIDVSEYPIESINVGLDNIGNKVVVEGRQDDDDKIATTFTQKVPLPRYADISSMTAHVNKKGVLKIEIPLLFFFPQDHPNLHNGPPQSFKGASLYERSRERSDVSRVDYNDDYDEGHPDFEVDYDRSRLRHDRYAGYDDRSPRRNHSYPTNYNINNKNSNNNYNINNKNSNNNYNNNNSTSLLHTTNYQQQQVSRHNKNSNSFQHNVNNFNKNTSFYHNYNNSNNYNNNFQHNNNNNSFQHNYKTPQDYDPKLVYGNSYVSEVTTDSKGRQTMEIVVKAGVCFNGDDVVVEIVDEKFLVVGVEVKPDNQKIMYKNNGRGLSNSGKDLKNGGKFVENDVIHIKTYSLPKSADPMAISCTMDSQGLVLIRIPLGG